MLPPHSTLALRRFLCSWNGAASALDAAATRKKNLVFLGSPQVSASILHKLLAASKAPDSIFQLAAIVTQPPAARDRGRKLMPSAVAQLALENGFPCELIFTPERATEVAFLSDLSALNPELCITAAYGNILPQKFLDIPSCGGQAKTLMFVHISPEMDAIGETLSTLKFAERVATVELGAARLNKDNGEVKELKEQIISLKAALARQNGEHAHHLRSTMSSPDIYRMRSGEASPGNPNPRQPMEEVGNIEVRGNGITIPKKPNYDLEELLTVNDASSCTDDKEVGDWVEKIVMDKLENDRDLESLREWEGDNVQLPSLFYQRYSPDTRVYSEQQRSGTESVATDDSDDLDIATSDSSEQDMMWQFNVPKVTSTGNGVVPRTKKPQSKAMKIPDSRSTNHVQNPSPSRKIPNALIQKSRQNRRPPSSNGVDGKRTASGKTGSSK